MILSRIHFSHRSTQLADRLAQEKSTPDTPIAIYSRLMSLLGGDREEPSGRLRTTDTAIPRQGRGSDPLPFSGTPPGTVSIDLCPGWNHLGIPTAEPRHPHVALSSIAGKWQRVFGHDAFDTEESLEVFDPAVLAYYNLNEKRGFDAECPTA